MLMVTLLWFEGIEAILQQKVIGFGDEFHDGRCDDRREGLFPHSFRINCCPVNIGSGLLIFVRGLQVHLNEYRILSLHGRAI
jgi:hypothetical protein